MSNLSQRIALLIALLCKSGSYDQYSDVLGKVLYPKNYQKTFSSFRDTLISGQLFCKQYLVICSCVCKRISSSKKRSKISITMKSLHLLSVCCDCACFTHLIFFKCFCCLSSLYFLLFSPCFSISFIIWVFILISEIMPRASKLCRDERQSNHLRHLNLHRSDWQHPVVQCRNRSFYPFHLKGSMLHWQSAAYVWKKMHKNMK